VYRIPQDLQKMESRREVTNGWAVVFKHGASENPVPETRHRQTLELSKRVDGEW